MHWFVKSMDWTVKFCSLTRSLTSCHRSVAGISHAQPRYARPTFLAIEHTTFCEVPSYTAFSMGIFREIVQDGEMTSSQTINLMIVRPTCLVMWMCRSVALCNSEICRISDIVWLLNIHCLVLLLPLGPSDLPAWYTWSSQKCAQSLLTTRSLYVQSITDI